MYLRFVNGTESENAFALNGVFTVAEALKNEGMMDRYECRWLEEIFEWFNTQLPCPPFRIKRKTGEWSRDAVSWFRDDAPQECLGRIWDLVALIENQGVPVRFVKAANPGWIVYRDDYQVVAETPAFWLRKKR